MPQDKMIHGFRLIEKRYSEETGSDAYLYKHEKSGATLLHLANDSKNKTFNIGFRTPPKNSAGVAHILEHSVLSGSEKFKTKEPFMDLIQTSMQTFLNAMTFADMTIYPVASKNDKDFQNLMEVYLDAVFFPMVYERPMIFKQEGWHYEMEDLESPITCNGVVYNEMRGAYASPERQVYMNLMKTLYPGSTYAHESGGDPWKIPELSYEEFLDFHKRLYHPSNCLIFLYGDMDFEPLAELIDRDYLSRFEKTEPDNQIDKGEVLSTFEEKTFVFNSEPGEEKEGDSILTYSIPCGVQEHAKETILSSLLNEVLLSGEAAPLRQALLEAGLGEEIEAFSSEGYYITFGVMAKKAKASRIQELKEITERVLKEQVEKGIDRDLVEASLNSTETQLRELGGPQRGVYLAIFAMYDFRLDMHPLTSISYNQALKEVRDELDNRILERFIEERILASKAGVLAVHEPDPECYKRLDEALRIRLENLKNEMSQEEKEALVAETQALKTYQQTEDSPEAKATIPSLGLADVSPKIEAIPEVEKELQGVKAYLHPVPSSGVNYNSLYFPLNHLSLDEMDDLSTLLLLISMVDTEAYDFRTLSTEIKKLSSGINFTTLASDKKGKLQRYLAVSFASLGEQVIKMSLLVNEILLNSRYDNVERAREILTREKLKAELVFDGNGHQVAMERVLAKYNRAYFLNDLIRNYDHLCRLLADKDLLAASLNRLPALAKKVFNKTGLLLYVTADEAAMGAVEKAYEASFKALPAAHFDAVEIENKLKKNKEAFTTSAGLNYVAMGADMERLGFDFKPGMTVLSNILSVAYLHNVIRAQGGAYGAGNMLKEDGSLAFFSYRDPKMKETYEVFKTVPDFIRNLPLDQADVEKAIIGSVNRFDPVITPMQVNSLTFARRLNNKSHEDQEALLAQLLKTTVDELKGYADIYEKVLAEDTVTVIGYDDTVEKDRDLFDTVERLKR